MHQFEDSCKEPQDRGPCSHSRPPGGPLHRRQDLETSRDRDRRRRRLSPGATAVARGGARAVWCPQPPAVPQGPSGRPEGNHAVTPRWLCRQRARADPRPYRATHRMAGRCHSPPAWTPPACPQNASRPVAVYPQNPTGFVEQKWVSGDGGVQAPRPPVRPSPVCRTPRGGTSAHAFRGLLRKPNGSSTLDGMRI
jgi:hypothetical protein